MKVFSGSGVSQCHRGVCCRDNRVWVTCFSARSCRGGVGGLRMVVQTSQDLNFSFLQRSLVGEGSEFNRGGGVELKVVLMGRLLQHPRSLTLGLRIHGEFSLQVMRNLDCGFWLFTRLQVVIISASRVLISLHLIQQHGGIWGSRIMCLHA